MVRRRRQRDRGALFLETTMARLPRARYVSGASGTGSAKWRCRMRHRVSRCIEKSWQTRSYVPNQAQDIVWVDGAYTGLVVDEEFEIVIELASGKPDFDLTIGRACPCPDIPGVCQRLF